MSFSGYEDVVVPVEVQAGQTTRLDVALTMERFAEEVVVTAVAIEPELFTAETQLVERQKAATATGDAASNWLRWTSWERAPTTDPSRSTERRCSPSAPPTANA